jgi:hypothetical protein
MTAGTCNDNGKGGGNCKGSGNCKGKGNGKADSSAALRNDKKKKATTSATPNQSFALDEG